MGSQRPFGHHFYRVGALRFAPEVNGAQKAVLKSDLIDGIDFLSNGDLLFDMHVSEVFSRRIQLVGYRSDVAKWCLGQVYSEQSSGFGDACLRFLGDIQIQNTVSTCYCRLHQRRLHPYASVGDGEVTLHDPAHLSGIDCLIVVKLSRISQTSLCTPPVCFHSAYCSHRSEEVLLSTQTSKVATLLRHFLL